MKCVIGLSGGVDSSTSAAIMKERGFEVVGCTFKMFESDKAKAAVNNAVKVADFLKIDHEVIDCSIEFKRHVVDCFIESYEKGITPSPCVLCNKFIKFVYLDAFRKKHQADVLATGHYVQIKKFGERIELSQAEDMKKDQSYFLYGVDREILKFAEFPLGKHPSKNYTRDLARKFGIPVAEQPESQDICFLPNSDYVSFIKNNSSRLHACGEIVNENGEILGKHSGTINYTIGQRKGLGLSGGPFFVCNIDAEKNRVVVSGKNGVETKKVFLDNVKFINDEFLGECEVKIRSIGQKNSAKIMREGDKYHVELYEPEYGAAKGQHCVFYDGSLLIGGGVIC